MSHELSDTAVSVRTFAEGLLSRLAHDLELRATPSSATFDGQRATLRFRVGDIAVQGVLKHGRVDSNVLSASDLKDIEGRILTSLKASADDHITLELELEGDVLRGTIQAPCGRTTVRLSAKQEEASPGVLRVTVTGKLSLSALGAGAVKGPMGSFRLADMVDFEGSCLARTEAP